MIVVCGVMRDAPIRILLGRLSILGYDYVFVDQAILPAGLRLKQEWEPGSRPRGGFVTERRTIDFDEVTGVFTRYAGYRKVGEEPGVQEAERSLLNSEINTACSLVWDHLECAVVNRSRKMISNDSKPAQALLAERLGFKVPRTLITSEPDRALEFWERCSRKMIFKSISGSRSTVREFLESDIERLHLIRSCPVQFQELVRGPNCRIHVVGDRIYALRIVTDEVDYRYAKSTYRECELPSEVAERCRYLTHYLGLLMSGIDLIEQDGEYYFLEANAMPGYSHFETNGYQKISEGLAHLLRNGKQAYQDLVLPFERSSYSTGRELEALAKVQLRPREASQIAERDLTSLGARSS